MFADMQKTLILRDRERKKRVLVKIDTFIISKNEKFSRMQALIWKRSKNFQVSQIYEVKFQTSQ